MKVEIVRLNHNGDGIGYLNGKIVFVPKTIVGDVVLISNLVEHKKYIEASVAEYVEYSSLREEIKCPYYSSCGGCQLMGLPYLEQLEYKKNKVIDILKKYGNIRVNPDINGGVQYKYRNKIILQVENGIIGLYKTLTNELVPIDNCMLVSDKINHLIKVIKDNISLINVSKVMIREANSKLMVVFYGKVDKSKVIDKLSSLVLSIYINEELIYGDRYLEEDLGDYSFDISPASFFQVNHDMTIKLYDCIKEYLGSGHKNVMDLYCGTGSIGIYVSSCCDKITGIEINHSSVMDARRNILKNKLNNIEVREGDVGKLLDDNNSYDAIIVDPPRSGLDKRTKMVLKSIKSKRIIYVSCNPITLARDLDELMGLYDVKEISLFDMFPNTYHVECVMWLCLKK